MGIENIRIESELKDYDEFMNLDYYTALKRLIYDKYQKRVSDFSSLDLAEDGLKLIKLPFDDNINLSQFYQHIFSILINYGETIFNNNIGTPAGLFKSNRCQSLLTMPLSIKDVKQLQDFNVKIKFNQIQNELQLILDWLLSALKHEYSSKNFRILKVTVLASLPDSNDQLLHLDYPTFMDNNETPGMIDNILVAILAIEDCTSFMFIPQSHKHKDSDSKVCNLKNLKKISFSKGWCCLFDGKLVHSGSRYENLNLNNRNKAK